MDRRQSLESCPSPTSLTKTWGPKCYVNTGVRKKYAFTYHEQLALRLGYNYAVVDVDVDN
jgi:hypothetical protein